MVNSNKKRAVVALRGMLNNARSLSEVNAVKARCDLNRIKFHLLSLGDVQFKNAMEFNQLDDFYYETTKS